MPNVTTNHAITAQRRPSKRNNKMQNAGLSWIPYAFGLVFFVASLSFLGTIAQAYLLVMGCTVEKSIIWQCITYYTTK